MQLRRLLRRSFRWAFATQGLQILSDSEIAALEERYRRAVAQLCGCITATLAPELEPTEGRIDMVAALRGTEPAEGWFLLARLRAALSVPGDVCEFGVAQGLTSAMFAGELLSSSRHLWLYDSFTGLPTASDKDTLIDDPLNLGTIDNYAGAMAFGPELAEAQLRRVGFPSERTHVVAGLVNERMDRGSVPSAICFAYVDLDLHDGIKAALEMIDERLSVGGYVIVDDYGYLSSGAKAATDTFVQCSDGRYATEVAPEWAGHFCSLRRIA